MTLGFSTKWPKQMEGLAGQPNYFIEKVWQSIESLPCLTEAKEFYDVAEPYELFEGWHIDLFDSQWDLPENQIKSKPHSIRQGNRWRPGMKIHPAINNRTKNRFQFAPTMELKSVQSIQICHYSELMHGKCKPIVQIDDIRLSEEEVLKLAVNDGFPSVEAFFQWFNQDFKGQIIHWTDLKY